MPVCWRQPKGEYRRPPLGTPLRPATSLIFKHKINMNVNAMKAHPCASIALLASMRGNYSLIMCFQVKLKGDYLNYGALIN